MCFHSIVKQDPILTALISPVRSFSETYDIESMLLIGAHACRMNAQALCFESPSRLPARFSLVLQTVR